MKTRHKIVFVMLIVVGSYGLGYAMGSRRCKKTGVSTASKTVTNSKRDIKLAPTGAIREKTIAPKKQDKTGEIGF